MLSLIISIIALGLIITIHEFGHFIAARAFRVGVIEFSVGMGPRLLSRVKKNTRYSLRLLPFGGSCMMLGEETEEDAKNAGVIEIDGRRYDPSEQFINKPAWQRFCVIFAGPFFNFLLAFFLSLILTSAVGYDVPLVTEVTEGFPMSDAGVEAGDEIIRLETGGDRYKVEGSRDISVFMTVHEEEMRTGEAFTVYYKDNSEGGIKKSVTVKPVFDEENNTNRLGFSYSLAYSRAGNLLDIIRYSVYNVKYCFRSAIESVKLLLRGNVSRDDVMGPVGMVAVMDETVDEASSYGVISVLLTLSDIVILLSGTLGVMNLLPVPALDGGRLVFILIEMITRHPVPRKWETRIHAVGMALLLALMFFVMFNDIMRLIR